MFGIKERGSNGKREVIAGVTTFMTMAYIIFVNPMILNGMGIPISAGITATCIAAALPTLIMGAWANYPFALASGMGLNALLTEVGKDPGVGWKTAMGIIVVEGCIIFILVATRIREAVMHAIPMDIKRAIGVGIGLFIAYLGLKQAGIIVPSSATGLTFGALHDRATLVSLLGLLATGILVARKIPGALLTGIAAATVIAVAFDNLHWGASASPLIGSLNQVVTTPKFDTFFQADVASAIARPELWIVILGFLLTDFFDTMGTVVSLGQQGNFIKKDGKIPLLSRILMVDSLAAIWGGLCGASSATTYIESAGGIGAGGRTGLANIVTAACFCAAIFFAPVISLAPACATAPVLVIVGYLMMDSIREIQFKDATIGIPSFLTLLIIPLASNITKGIGAGFIAFAVLKLMSGRGKEAPIALYLLALIFTAAFLMEALTGFF